MTTRRDFLRKVLSAAVATALPKVPAPPPLTSSNPLFHGTLGRYEGVRYYEPDAITLADIRRLREHAERFAIPGPPRMALGRKVFERGVSEGWLKKSDVMARYEECVVIDPKTLFSEGVLMSDSYPGPTSEGLAKMAAAEAQAEMPRYRSHKEVWALKMSSPGYAQAWKTVLPCNQTVW